MAEETFKYAASPDSSEVATAAWEAIQTCREVYNHALTQEYRPRADGAKPTYTEMQNKLPDWKKQWPRWSEVYSKSLQMAVRRIKQSESVLESLQERGYEVGRLIWKAPDEFRSIVYNQSGFDVDCNTDRTEHATVDFSKIGAFDLQYHRPLPEDGEITQIILKKEKTGNWSVSIVVDYEPDYPDSPAIADIDTADTVGIDLGITSFIHDSDGRSFQSLDEQIDRERIERRHRDLSRKDHGSKNWEKARLRLAQAYKRLENRRKDYREKLAHEYTNQYDAVFLEDLNVQPMLEGYRNSRNVAAMSWRKTIQTFKRHGEKNGCHIVEVPPEGTTKRCSQCGVETDKDLWVREHSCPSCGFKADRDYNAALEIKRLGLVKLGVWESRTNVGQGMAESTSAESAGDSAGRTRASLSSTSPEIYDFWCANESQSDSSTPAETALTGDTTSVSPKRVVETGSPTLNDRTASAVCE